MVDPAKEQEHLAEAERLARLPREDQREILALHRAVAANRRLPKNDRDAAQERADALELLLRRLNRRRKKS